MKLSEIIELELWSKMYGITFISIFNLWFWFNDFDTPLISKIILNIGALLFLYQTTKEMLK